MQSGIVAFTAEIIKSGYLLKLPIKKNKIFRSIRLKESENYCTLFREISAKILLRIVRNEYFERFSPVKNNNSNILVTGGGGFLGQAIIRQLIARNEKVCSFSRQFYPELEKMGVHQIQGDIADKASVESACKGMESVFHAAAKPGVWGDYDEYYRANVVGTENVIAACFENKVSRLIYTSSPSVIFNGKDMEGVNESVPYPETYHAHYPKTKAIAERLVIAAAQKGLKTIILRPHLIWGPGDNHLVPRILAKAKRLRKIGDGKNLVDTIYIDNAAYAHILAADKLISNPGLSGKIYFVSQDEPIALWDMVNAI
ncbi:MAG: NAD-dependent epimerase/dehydratase family protein, partial [Desulfobacteraceae bacterium]|nr:NAD-dependent epimerase/dehydratase family protein [Desulfobacteraceae bacterium]